MCLWRVGASSPDVSPQILRENGIKSSPDRRPRGSFLLPDHLGFSGTFLVVWRSGGPKDTLFWDPELRQLDPAISLMPAP